jgi:syntaxin 5
MPSLLTGAVTGLAPDTQINIPDQSQVSLLQSRDNYVQERANAMQNIESTIEEIGGIFQQLATMVAEQGESVERIDREVDLTVRDSSFVILSCT